MIANLGGVTELWTEKEVAIRMVAGVAGVMNRFAADEDGGSYETDNAMFEMLANVLLDSVATMELDDDKAYTICAS